MAASKTEEFIKKRCASREEADQNSTKSRSSTTLLYKGWGFYAILGFVVHSNSLGSSCILKSVTWSSRHNFKHPRLMAS